MVTSLSVKSPAAKHASRFLFLVAVELSWLIRRTADSLRTDDLTAPFSYLAQRRANNGRVGKDHKGPSTRWRSAPTAACSLPAAATARSFSGKCRTERACPPH